jgi:hypothetical protein
MRRVLVSACLLALVPAAAAADENDYRPENEDWNGLSELFAIARSAGLRPEMRAEIAWDQVGEDDGVAILYPRVQPDAARLRDYVAHGGRALLGDDFGAAAPVFTSFGLERVAPPPGARYQGLAALPIAETTPHPLAAGVSKLVTNHPAAFRLAAPAADVHPVATFAPGVLVCAEIVRGTGRLVVLSDPSVLINNMLELSENRAFAYNLVARLARPGGRLLVVSQEYSERGQPRPSAGTRRQATGPLADFNRFLRELSAFLPSEAGLRMLALAASLGATALLLLRLPWPRSEEARWLRPFGAAAEEPRGAELLGLLREDVDRRLTQALALSEPASRMAPSELGACLAAQLDPGLARRTGRLFARLSAAHVPARRVPRLTLEAERLLVQVETSAGERLS